MKEADTAEGRLADILDDDVIVVESRYGDRYKLSRHDTALVQAALRSAANLKGHRDDPSST